MDDAGNRQPACCIAIHIQPQQDGVEGDTAGVLTAAGQDTKAAESGGRAATWRAGGERLLL